jgi:ribose transport system permease protein
MTGSTASPGAGPAPGPAPGSTSRRGVLTPALRDQITVITPLLLALVVVGWYATTASEFFLTEGNARNLVRQVAALAIIALAQTPLLIAGQLDLSVASAASLASVVGALLLTGGVAEPAVIVLVVALGAGIGLAVGLIVSYTRVPPFILTLGLLSVLLAIANILSRNRQIPTGTSLSYLSVGAIGPIPAPALIVLAIAVLLSLMLGYTKLGRYAFATGSNESAAFLSGVPTIRTKLVLYTLNQALVALAGVLLLGRLGGGDPQAASGLELQAITAVVLGGASLVGGRGSILGTLLGVLLIGMISNALNVAGVEHAYVQLVYGAVLMLSVVYSALVGTRRVRRRVEEPEPAADG